MTRLIDADALSKSVLEWLPSDPSGSPEAEHPFETDICVSMLMEIEDAPTIDAIEVVRCKDCIHWFSHTQCGFDEDNDEYHDYCGLLIPDDDYYAYRRKADDYCSYGARMPGEDGEEE